MRTPKLPDLPAEDETLSHNPSEKTGGVRSSGPHADPLKKKSTEEDEFDALAKRFEMLKKR